LRSPSAVGRSVTWSSSNEYADYSRHSTAKLANLLKGTSLYSCSLNLPICSFLGVQFLSGNVKYSSGNPVVGKPCRVGHSTAKLVEDALYRVVIVVVCVFGLVCNIINLTIIILTYLSFSTV